MKVNELTGGMMGTPFDFSSSRPGPSTFRSEENNVWHDVTLGLEKTLGVGRHRGGRGAMTDETFGKFVNWAKEKQVKYMLNMLGLSAKDDLHWDTMKETLPKYIRMRQQTMSRGNVSEAVNNPEEMTHDDAVVYLLNLTNANDELMNDLYITDPDPSEDEVIYSGTSIYDALVTLGEMEPEVEPEQEYDEDDPWTPNGMGPYWEREYDYEEKSLVELMAEKNPQTGEWEMEGPEGDTVSVDEWMDYANYDLNWDVPMHVRRPDGQPFDEEDVANINSWFKDEYANRIKKRSPGIHVELWVRQGDTEADTHWELH